MGIERGIIKPVVKFAAPIAIILAELASGCKSGSKAAQPAVKESPFTPTAITQECDPETYAQQLRLRGIPTPVGVGGGETGKEEEEFKEIMRIAGEMNTCGTVTTADGQTVVDWNLAHPQIDEVPTPQSTLPPDITPDPKPSETAVSDPPEDEEETTPCTITNPELCAQAERIQIVRKDLDGRIETYIALNPTEKTPFYAGENGELLDKFKESGNPFKGNTALLRTPNRGYRIIGLKFDDMLQVENPKQGSLIGEYSPDDETPNYGAKVLTTITKRTPDGPVIDEKALEKEFPAAYKKPIKATYTVKGPAKPNVLPSYVPTPPQ